MGCVPRGIRNCVSSLTIVLIVTFVGWLVIFPVTDIVIQCIHPERSRLGSVHSLLGMLRKQAMLYQTTHGALPGRVEDLPDQGWRTWHWPYEHPEDCIVFNPNASLITHDWLIAYVCPPNSDRDLVIMVRIGRETTESGNVSHKEFESMRHMGSATPRD